MPAAWLLIASMTSTICRLFQWLVSAPYSVDDIANADRPCLPGFRQKLYQKARALILRPGIRPSAGQMGKSPPSVVLPCGQGESGMFRDCKCVSVSVDTCASMLARTGFPVCGSSRNVHVGALSILFCVCVCACTPAGDWSVSVCVWGHSPCL